jgi:hypothetical protein
MAHTHTALGGEGQHPLQAHVRAIADAKFPDATRA